MPSSPEPLWVDLAFMVFGLGFFLFVVHYIVRDSKYNETVQYERRISEMREFGFRDDDAPSTDEEPSRPTRRFRKRR